MADYPDTYPYSATQRALARRRAMALALQQQSMEPIEAPNYPGAQVSPWQGAAKLAQALIGGLSNRRLDTEEKQLEGKLQSERARMGRTMAEAITPMPSITETPIGDVPGSATAGPLPSQATITNLPDLRPRDQTVAALATGFASADPMQQQMASLLAQDVLGQQKEGRTEKFTASQNALSRALTSRGQDIEQDVAKARLRQELDLANRPKPFGGYTPGDIFGIEYPQTGKREIQGTVPSVAKAPEVKWSNDGIPVAINDSNGQQYVIGQPMPPHLKPLADAALAAHQQRQRERDTATVGRDAAIEDRQDKRIAAREVGKYYDNLVAAKSLHRSMSDAYARIQKGTSKAVGADDMIILSNHIAMTLGQVKGARTGRDLIEEHKRARDLPSNLQVLVDGWREGAQLSPGQREEFINAAGDRLANFQGQYTQAKQDWNYTPPGEAATLSSKPPTMILNGKTLTLGPDGKYH